MTIYMSYYRTPFKKNTIYRIEWLMGILNTCIQIFISVTIWKSLYAGKEIVNGVSFSVIVTNFIISQGLSNVFYTNDSVIQRKLRDGSIANELLKPVDYRKILLAENLGEVAFRLVSNFIPSVIITSLIIGILPPAGGMAMFLYIVSMILGFAVLWSISLIVQMLAFWVMNIWSISIIKNVLISVLSGALLPLWFMPQMILNIIKFTPFETVYYIPLRIYLGQMELTQIGLSMLIQIVWIVILYSISVLLWNFGKKKIVLQGG